MPHLISAFDNLSASLRFLLRGTGLSLLGAGGLLLLIPDSPLWGQENSPPPSGPPTMVPPPPPDIKPPALPPDMRPPRFEREGMPKAGPEMDESGRNEMAMIERFLSMPPETLAKIRRTLERIEAMSTEEKEQLLERVRDFRRMDEKRRRDLMSQFRGMDRGQGRVLARHLFSMPAEDREAEIKKIRAMEPDERRAYMQALRDEFQKDTDAGRQERRGSPSP